MLFVEETVPHPGLVFPPSKQQPPEDATSPSPDELFLAVEANLRSREFLQDLRIDRGRFNGEPGERAGD